MITYDQPPFGRAVRIDEVFAAIREWGYPVLLRRPLRDIRTELHEASQKGALDRVRSLIHDCYQVDARDELGLTPLMEAVAHKRLEIARTLADAGASANADTRWWSAVAKHFSESAAGLDESRLWNGAGITPVVLVILQKDAEMLKLLLSRGGDVSNEIHLKWLARVGTPAMAEIFVASGADRKAVAGFSAEEGNGAVIEWLLRTGLDPDTNPSKYSNHSLLNSAIDNEQVEVVKILLRAGANTGIKSTKYIGGHTPLQLAVSKGRLDIVKLLVEHGADVNPSGEYTPLQRAISSQKLESNERLDIVKLLVEYGADVNPSGSTGLDLAIDNNHAEVAKLLVEHGGIYRKTLTDTREYRIRPFVEALEKQGDYTIALDLMKKLLAEHPESSDFHRIRLGTALQVKEFDVVEEELRFLMGAPGSPLETQTKRPLARALLGFVLAEKPGREAEASRHLAEAVPRLRETYQRSRESSAKEGFEVQNAFWLICALWKLGRKDEALETLRDARQKYKQAQALANLPEKLKDECVLSEQR